MADPEDDKDVSRRYRELPHEEPPSALDARIRAEARSALETHAAPLVPPTGRRSWYFPVAAAAVIMLAVAVTYQVEREQPPEAVAIAPEAKESVPEKRKAEEAKPQQPAPRIDSLAKQQKDRAVADAMTGARSRDEFSRDNRARQERPAASPPAAAPAESAAGAVARSKVAEETPEAWLERIARLRTEGRHDDADKALAEFRKRHPDYKIPPETLKKVERP